MQKISLVISLFNSSETCHELLTRLKNVANSHKKYFFEFIFVDDASKDFDISPFNLFISKSYCVRVIQLNKNHGQIISILTGLHYCTGDAAIIMSSDLQDPPELITQMLHTYETSTYEVVACTRKERHDPLFRQLGAFVWYKIVTAFINPNFPKKGADYALINQRITNLLNENKSIIRYLQNEIILSSKKIVFIEYTRAANRKKRKTEWKVHKMIQLMLDIIFTHINPIKIYLSMNILFSLIITLLYLLSYHLNFLMLGVIAITIIGNLFFALQLIRLRKREKIIFNPEKISKTILFQ